MVNYFAPWLAFQTLTWLLNRILIMTETNTLNQISTVHEFVTNFVAKRLRRFLQVKQCMERISVICYIWCLCTFTLNFISKRQGLLLFAVSRKRQSEKEIVYCLPAYICGRLFFSQGCRTIFWRSTDKSCSSGFNN